MDIDVTIEPDCTVCYISIKDNKSYSKEDIEIDESGKYTIMEIHNLSSSDFDDYVITMTLKIPGSASKIYTFRSSCIDQGFGEKDFSIMCLSKR